jgi:hypothetical protein
MIQLTVQILRINHLQNSMAHLILMVKLNQFSQNRHIKRVAHRGNKQMQNKRGIVSYK